MFEEKYKCFAYKIDRLKS